MSQRDLALVIYRALIAIAAAIRKYYGFVDYRNISIVMQDSEFTTSPNATIEAMEGK